METIILELVNEMAGEREANPEAFDLLLSFLLNLEEEEPQEERLRMFEIRMLSLFGYQPNMKRCDLCKKGLGGFEGSPARLFLS